MRSPFIVSVATVTLMVGATALTPSFATANSNSIANTLTKAQRETLWNDLKGHAVTAMPPSQFPAEVGTKVPSTVPLMGMPANAAQAVPTVKSDDYTTRNGELFIVDPTSRKIVDVIGG